MEIGSYHISQIHFLKPTNSFLMNLSYTINIEHDL